MKTFFSIIVLIPFSFSYSQNYFPLVEENNEWNVLNQYYIPIPMPQVYYTETFKLSGDTLIEDEMYMKLFMSEEEDPFTWNYIGALREDQQKVWYFPENSYSESLLYDFNLQQGDTVNFLYEPMVVDSVVYKPINGTDRKHIFFSYYGISEFTEFWIEGIGSNRGVVYGGTALFVGGWYYILCKSENNELVYMNPDYQTCYMISTGIEENDAEPNLVLRPNPARGKFEIRSSMFEVEGSKIISIYNEMGVKVQEVRKMDRSETIYMDAKDLRKGFYFIRMEMNGKTYSSKLVVQ